MTYMANTVNKNTNYQYVVNNFFTDVYEKEEFGSFYLENETKRKYVLRQGTKEIEISKMYSNDDLDADYKGYYGNVSYGRIIFKKVFVLLISILMLCSIDVLISRNKANTYLNNVNVSYEKVNDNLVNYGYNLLIDKNHLLLEYRKKVGLNKSSINITIDKNGVIRLLDSEIYLDNFIDVASVRYLMNDISLCDINDIDKLVTVVDNCINQKCIDNLVVDCGNNKYLFNNKKILNIVTK